MTRALALLLTLCACDTPPEVNALSAKPGLKTPALLTADQLAAVNATTGTADDPLAARTASLRARADALRAQ